jgi:hypothetical protein
MAKASSTFLLRGTSGNDVFRVPDGRTLLNTSFDGGRGNDTLDLSSYATSGVTVRLLEGYAKIHGSVVTDLSFTGVVGSYPTITNSTTVRGTIKGIENVIGSGGNDFLSADINGGVVRLDGGGGNDALQAYGNIAGATLIGGLGSDWFDAYKSGTILIGGTLDAAGGAHGDGEYDVFSIANAATIRDFEVNIDRLIFSSNHSMDAAYAAGTWITDGAGGSIFMVGGQAKLTLTGVAPDVAATIPYGFQYSPENGVLQGSSGDDVLHLGSSFVERVVIGQSNGDDIVLQFAKGTDIIQFTDGLQPVWSNTYVNGQKALLGSFDGGSVTLTGLSTDDVPALNIEGVGDPAQYGAAGISSWSVPTDAALFFI